MLGEVLNDYVKSTKEPPSDIATALLTQLRVPLKALFDEVDNCWQIYRIKDRQLLYQLTIPSNILTMGVVDYIKKHDQTNFGKDDDEYRQKRFLEWFRAKQYDPDREAKEKHIDEQVYRLQDVCKYLERISYQGIRQICVPVTVGYRQEGNRTIPIRAYKKKGVPVSG